MRDASPNPGVIPAKAGIQCLFATKTLGPRLRGDDNREDHDTTVRSPRADSVRLHAGGSAAVDPGLRATIFQNPRP
jgi:hypothetical protein